MNHDSYRAVTDQDAAQHFTRFALEEAKRTIRAELAAMPPMHAGRAEKHAELDQLDDMLTRRR